ncbi:MAG TPA: 50S ribosomal protein L22 [Terriglobales bacterium]|jgi:large subunit ribosomal protein L22
MAEATHTVRAIARYVRVSPQKARLVVDLIRGLKAEDALHRLRFTQKRIAADVAKLLQSAIANATDRADLGLDVDALYVTRAFVNEGPRQKRIRPAPMGRAYRYQRRSSHIEIHVGAKPGAAALAGTVSPAPAAAAAPAKPSPRKPLAAKKPAAAKTGAGKKPAAKQPAAKNRAAKAPTKKAAKSEPKSEA